MKANEANSSPIPGAGPMVAGKVVILGLLLFAVAASVVSWVYYARLQSRPISLWGSRAAELMLRAPTIRCFRLLPAAENAEQAAAGAGREITIAGDQYFCTDERDISQARGVSHIRQGLIHDRSFAWDELPSGGEPGWAFAIEFDDGGDRALVAFDFHSARAALAGGERTVSVRPVAGAIEEFLREQYPAAAPSARP